jgi:hypothetical protein
MLKRKRVLLVVTCLSALSSLVFGQSPKTAVVRSPSKKIKAEFSLTSSGQASYRVFYNNKIIIKPSTLGFEFKTAAPLTTNLDIVNIKNTSFKETWNLPWGEQENVVNHHNELRIELKENKAPHRLVNIVFRAFNDGVGFRYEFPEQKGMDEVIVANENTNFSLTGNHEVWWTPGDWDTYEHPYTHSHVSKVNAFCFKKNTLANSHIVENSVNPPATMKTSEGIYLSFLEASLVDYATMTLQVDTSNYTLKSSLVGSDLLGYKVKTKVPFNTPWRVVLIADKAALLVESNLILNLNEPNKIGDVSWFKPTKYVGIWWEMHLNKSSWDVASGKHGATTENTKRYIDFASKNNIGGVLVEGWNTGWERWIGFPDREGVFDFVTPYKDYNIQEVVSYGKSKGVELFIHNETSSAPRTYEKQLDTAFTMYETLGVHAIKTGYVGPIIPDGEYHHGQWMVNHYQKVVDHAAKHKIAVNVHEPVGPSGLRRTYPNLVSGEGLRGQEFNAWADDGGNKTDHLTIIPFTRMLAGPIDYTPGIFNLKLKPHKDKNQVNTTLAQQLALYVVIYSPIQMAADLIESYEGHPAFQFVRDVGVDWKQSKVLNAEVGQYITIAREEKGTGNWFIGSITNQEPRDLKIKLDFLDAKKTYKAIIYRDGPNAHWDKNPSDYKIEEKTVKKNTELSLVLKPGGGTAISIFEE